MHIYKVQPRKDHRGVDLMSDVLPFGRLYYDTRANEQNSVENKNRAITNRKKNDRPSVAKPCSGGGALASAIFVLHRLNSPRYWTLVLSPLDSPQPFPQCRAFAKPFRPIQGAFHARVRAPVERFRKRLRAILQPVT